MLKKEVRRALCRGWWELDLRSSQLAICARLWGARRAEAFLRSGKSVWRELAEWYEGRVPGLRLLTADGVDEEFKAAMKAALYSLMFGASWTTIVDGLDLGLAPLAMSLPPSWSESPGGEQFREHPLMRSLGRHRSIQKNRIRRAGGAATPFGELACDGSDKSARSALARQAQAVELWLLLPVLDIARSTDELDIVLWQHDGFSLAFKNRSKAERWIGRIREAVKCRAEKMGIITELEGEEL